MCSSGPLPRHILGPMRAVAIGVSLLVALLAACARPKLAGPDLGATAAPDFTLTDGVSGRSVSLSPQRGQEVALTFLSTTCQAVCPLTASRFRAAQDSLGADAARATFI